MGGCYREALRDCIYVTDGLCLSYVTLYKIYIKKSQEGTSSLQKHWIRRSFFHLLQILNRIYPTATKLLVTIATLSIVHPQYHRVFLRVPLSHPFRRSRNSSKSFWLVLKVLITQMIHFPAAVSTVVASVIYAKIILEKVKFFVAVLQSVFAI